MLTFKTAILFWLLVALVPLVTSIAYFRASPATEPVAQRVAVSLHGAAVSILCIGVILIGIFGSPRPEFGEPFRLLLGAAVALIAYSLWRFHGKRAVHFLQSINLLWLAFAYFLGSMAITGIWL